MIVKACDINVGYTRHTNSLSVYISLMFNDIINHLNVQVVSSGIMYHIACGISHQWMLLNRYLRNINLNRKFQNKGYKYIHYKMGDLL